MIDVYQYFDYRKLLRDLYLDKRAQNPKVSFRYICLKTGIKSAGYLYNIVSGRSKLPLHLVLQLSQFFGLGRAEAEFLDLLVQFNEAKKPNEKAHLFDRILKLKKSKVKTLDPSYFELFSHWYYVVIRELLDFYEFKGDFRELAKMTSPPITPKEAMRAIQVLESVGLIRKNEAGRYERLDALISSGDEVRSMAVFHFQKATLNLARRAFDVFGLEERDISTLTIGISHQNFARVKEILRNSRREIMELAKFDDRADTVYQLEFFAFPVTKKGSGR